AQLDPAADRIDRLVARHRDQPAARLVRRALGRPARHRGGKRILDGFLGEVEVAVGYPDRRREHPRSLAAKYSFDRRSALHVVILARSLLAAARRDRPPAARYRKP